jgi:peptidoglycan/LPS O-acetylase OafA/YrhL
VGTLRFYLAVCVFLAHCWPTEHRHVLGSFAAVYCFFILSGFYIAMVLSQTYPASADGSRRFYLNRMLRLFPIYLAVLVATAMAYAAGLVPSGVPGLNGFALLPALDQITVLPQVLWRNVSLDTGPSSNGLAIGWYYTVGLEMMFYALAPLFVRWKLPALLLLFAASVAMHFLPAMLNLPERQWQYEFFPAVLMFFVAGVLAYRLTRAIGRAGGRAGWAVVPAMVAYGAYHDSQIFTNQLGPLAMYAVLALTLPFLFEASRQSRFDKFLGDLSYPFYVVHGLAAGLAGAEIGGTGRLANVIAALLLTTAASIALLFLVGRPTERLRDAVRRTRLERPLSAPIKAPLPPAPAR